MNISLLTNSLAPLEKNDLKTIASWAMSNDISELDVGPSIEMNREVFEQVMARGMKINTMIYCRNFLCSNQEEAKHHQDKLIEIIKFAGSLGIEKVVCSTGVLDVSYDNLGFHPERSMDACVELAKKNLDEAEKDNVKIAWENCPVMGNIAVSPDMWEELFDKLDSDKLGLCYDPSHLVWQFIDPYENIFKFKDKIFHFHAKDTHVDKDKLSIYGVQQNSKWWIHRLPGLGDLDWNRIIDDLYQIGYQGSIAIEHEDPIWSGSEEKVKQGILIARNCLNRYLVK
jgi:sugar phosphate isomerase/epimerase